jgi:hypothetical protein
MAMRWDHVLDFLHLHLDRPDPLRGSVKDPFPGNITAPGRVPLETSWYEPYEETAIGYEAGWVGIFQNQGK